MDQKALRREVEDLERHIADVTSQLHEMSKEKEAYTKLFSELSLAEHQVALLKDSLGQTEYQRLVREVEELEEEAKEGARAMEEKKEVMRALQEKIADLERDTASAPKQKEALIRSAEAKVKEAKKGVSDIQKECKAAVVARQKLEFELKEMEEEAGSLSAQRDACDKAIEHMEEEVARTQESLDQLRAAFAEKNNELSEARARLNEVFREMEEEKEKLEREIGDVSEHILTTEHSIASFEKEKRDAEVTVNALSKEHPWIAAEKSLFGRPKSPYDFDSKNVTELRARLKSLKEEEGRLFGSINRKVKDMFETADHRYKVLKQRIEIIQRDKADIQRVIDDLDKKKNVALESAFARVNEDMGKIFSTLLPGAVARLDPLREEGGVLGGLEVRVAFSGVWKESLSELSGGQRWVYLTFSFSFSLFFRFHFQCLFGFVHIISYPPLSLSSPLHPKVAPCTLSHFGSPPLQASANVRPRRDRRGARPFAHPKHRTNNPHSLLQLSIHHRFS